jgi:formylglycine-generating enzyme required for sulfatase activity
MVALVLAVAASAAPAEITLELVMVGNAGNAADSTGYGSVADVYAIGKYEVTAGQYTAFLNAVAATDTYGLYNANMWSNSSGCKIQQSGSAGSYTYSVAADRANAPVNYVSWGDAARFMNWLHNDQRTGAQDVDTTEDGAYYLNGATADAGLLAVARKEGAKFWIPTENEWYKAAYHLNDGVTGNYWDYPTSSDSKPGRDLADVTGNNANYKEGTPYPILPPYYTTEVGEFQNSDSPYGTFDQGGNVTEWNEELFDGSSRVLRGGSFLGDSSYLLASYRNSPGRPEVELRSIGFRVASVPEPGSLTLMLCGGLAGLYWWKRRK